MLGVSIYSGMEYSLRENLAYLELANSYGIKTLFTSLHIPEADDRVYHETKEILVKTKELNMKVIADISKDFMSRLKLEDYNIYALRLDFGFSQREIADFTRKYPFKIQLNASTISRGYLSQLKELGADFDRLEAGHNYYPRRDTGIAYELLIERNRAFREYGLSTMAFIPSREGKRGPIYEGLPTLEAHRDINPIVAAQHLLRSETDLVVVGDAFASEAELKALSEIDNSLYSLPFRPINITGEEALIINGIHTNRMDPGEFVIRSQEARLRKALPIKNKQSMDRKKYYITIDNEGYLRYEGELQIMRRDHLADERVNVVGDATEAALLIDLIRPGDSFRLISE